MANVILNSRLSGQNVGGKFVYLGFIAWTNASNTLDPNHPSQRNILPNSSSDTCFGIATDVEDIANADLTPSVLQYIGTHVDNPYGADPNTPVIGALGAVFSYNTSITFTGKTPGYYGFMYLVGDVNNDGVLAGECGDVECFEIEVVEEYPNYDDLTLAYCQEVAPTSIDLFDLLDTENGNALVVGGAWTAAAGIPGATLNTSTGNLTTIPVNPVPGTYNYAYTLTAEQMGAYHDILPGTCTTEVVNVVIIITANLSAGVGASAAVCNG